LPIFSSILGVFVLIHGIWGKSITTFIAGYHILIISAIGAGAEEMVEHLQGVSESIIVEHAESAMSSLIALIIVGAISLVGVFVTIKSTSLSRPLLFVVLLGSPVVRPRCTYRIPGRTGHTY
jgi:hypothetical protein